MQRITVFLALLWMSIPGFSQFFTDKTGGKLRKGIAKYEGFVNFYHDETTDKIYLEIAKLDQELLYVNALSQGIGSNDIGLDRGQLGKERIVKFKKFGNKLLLIQPNLKYKANSKNNLEKTSVEEAFAKSVIFGFEIKENKFKITVYR